MKKAKITQNLTEMLYTMMVMSIGLCMESSLFTVVALSPGFILFSKFKISECVTFPNYNEGEVFSS